MKVNYSNEVAVKKFKRFFTAPSKQPDPFVSWAHRSGDDADNAWRLSGEFGVIAEIAFEGRLKRVYEANRRIGECA